VFHVEQAVGTDPRPSAAATNRGDRPVAHSLLFRRCDGEVIVHCPRSKIDVKDPFPDVHAAAIKEINASPNAPVMRRYVRGLAELDNVKASQLLVEIVLKSPDRPTAAMAVAALERLHGNAKLWTKHYTGENTKIPESLEKRVATRLARKKEALKWWRKVGRPKDALIRIDEPSPAPRGTGKTLRKHLKQVEAREKPLGR
jgi:hypothetical protein